jgi:hypothetical protein
MSSAYVAGIVCPVLRAVVEQGPTHDPFIFSVEDNPRIGSASAREATRRRLEENGFIS